MIVWRITNYPTLDGSGGLRTSGRWHSRGRRVVYCALEPASALIEMLAHLEIDQDDLPLNYRLLKIDVPESVSRDRVAATALKSSWRQDPAATRRIGNAWLRSSRTALLFVPSAIVPETENILINPTHPTAASIRVVEIREHPLDSRLR